jgi:hypothetical protein
MPFVEEAGQVVSFAEFQDVVNKDQRLFEANEGLSDDIIEAQLQRATERILTKLRSSAWWRSYYIRRDTDNISFNTVADVPPVQANRIKARQGDFTDLCVFVALSDFILPSVADFGNDNNAERQKMGYYKVKGEELFGELITAGDWYDFDNDGTVQSGEKSPGQFNLRRVR